MKGNFEAAKAAGAEGANGWYCADTIEQLAEYIGVEPAALSATVEQYNKVCAEGYDSDFAKDPHFLNAVAKAPFYAHVTTPSLGFALVTTGGFVTTNDQQVLNEDYQPSRPVRFRQHLRYALWSRVYHPDPRCEHWYVPDAGPRAGQVSGCKVSSCLRQSLIGCRKAP